MLELRPSFLAHPHRSSLLRQIKRDEDSDCWDHSKNYWQDLPRKTILEMPLWACLSVRQDLGEQNYGESEGSWFIGTFFKVVLEKQEAGLSPDGRLRTHRLLYSHAPSNRHQKLWDRPAKLLFLLRLPQWHSLELQASTDLAICQGKQFQSSQRAAV